MIKVYCLSEKTGVRNVQETAESRGASSSSANAPLQMLIATHATQVHSNCYFSIKIWGRLWHPGKSSETEGKRRLENTEPHTQHTVLPIQGRTAKISSHEIFQHLMLQSGCNSVGTSKARSVQHTCATDAATTNKMNHWEA